MDPNDLRARVEVEIRDLIEPVAWERWRGRQPGGTGELAACARSVGREVKAIGGNWSRPFNCNWNSIGELGQLQLEWGPACRGRPPTAAGRRHIRGSNDQHLAIALRQRHDRRADGHLDPICRYAQVNNIERN